jgi:hypothetical protein
MKVSTTIALALALTLCTAGGAWAQGGMGRGGRMYNPSTVETVSGEVASVQTVPGKRRGQGGVHVVLKDEKGEIAVHLGPSWYLDKEGLKVVPGDHIEVRGSRVTYEGKPAIIAAEVKKGEKSFRLRDDSGVPAWSRRGRS